MSLPQPSRLPWTLPIHEFIHSRIPACKNHLWSVYLTLPGLIMERTAGMRWAMQIPLTVKILMRQGLSGMWFFFAQLDAFQGGERFNTGAQRDLIKGQIWKSWGEVTAVLWGEKGISSFRIPATISLLLFFFFLWHIFVWKILHTHTRVERRV